MWMQLCTIRSQMPFAQYQMWMIMDNQPDFWRPLLSGKRFQKMMIIQIKRLKEHLSCVWFLNTLIPHACRNVLGTKNLGDILSERESIASAMQSTLDEATDPWGVKVERVEV